MVNNVDTWYKLMQTRSAGHAVDIGRANVVLESVRDGEEMVEQAVFRGVIARSSLRRFPVLLERCTQ